MSFFHSLSLIYPSALWAFLVIPGLWFILKMYPPSPKNIYFPPIQFLKNLLKQDETSSTTPIWLLIYRILIVSLIIFAFANPIYNPASILSKSGPLVLIMDDSWPAAINWEKRKNEIIEYIDQAERKNIPIVFITTAKKGENIDSELFLSPKNARAKLEILNPNPWPADIDYINKRLDKLAQDNTYNLIWLWDGINHDTQEKYQRLILRLSEMGKLKIINYLNNLSTKIISNVTSTSDNNISIELIRSVGTVEEKVNIRALGSNGEILSRKEVIFALGSRKTKIDMKLPAKIKRDLSHLKIENINNVGSIYLLDDKWKKRNVGIFGDKALLRAQPLLSPIYYLDRAVKPFSVIKLGEINEIVGHDISVIFLPGIGKISSENINYLKEWISKGGTLVRFAGPNLVGSNNDLLPVKIRSSNSRNLGGVLSWDQPASIKEFKKESPFYGIKIQNDIFIERQVIAEPSQELNSLTWASLEDGTPLITAQKIQKGWNIFFHITANADWSNLPLSGTFVEILERIISLSFLSNNSTNNETLAPYRLLDGFGKLTEPYSHSTSLQLGQSEVAISYKNSPGFYGNDMYRKAFNLGKNINKLEPLVVSLPETVDYEESIPNKSVYLKSWVILIAIILIFIDYFLSLVIRGKLKLERMFVNNIFSTIALIIIFMINLHSSNVQADEKLIALHPSLGYIETENIEINEISKIGLVSLSKVLEQRTSILLNHPKKINIEKDSIEFFPLIYWPIHENSKTVSLSENVLLKIRNYIENGGLLIFDTRDANPSGVIINKVTVEQKILKQILRPLDLPALIPIPADHVLKRSFYLLNELPGRWKGENVWVEATAENSRDGVSSIIIGRHDWAAAWAKSDNKPLFLVVPGGEKQREYAYRFGINLVMYAMTGNYKADQVHIKSILKRLQNLNFSEGQKRPKSPEYELDSYTKNKLNELFREIEDQENENE